MTADRFSQFAVVDWSGAAVEHPPGLALACAAAGNVAPALIAPKRGWSRAALLDWLRGQAVAQTPMLIGLDLSPALPFADQGAYFPGWSHSPANAPELWALVDALCADDPHFGAQSCVTHDQAGRHFRRQRDCGDLVPPGRGRLRRCEVAQQAAGLNPYSVFNLVGAAQVGKSSLTGMRILHRLRGQIAVWPFDPIPSTGPVIVEIYTALAALAAGRRAGRSKIRDAAALDDALAQLGSAPHSPLTRYTDHATDAIMTCAWLRGAARDPALWSLTDFAAQEGWTFGIAPR